VPCVRLLVLASAAASLILTALFLSRGSWLLCADNLMLIVISAHRWFHDPNDKQSEKELAWHVVQRRRRCTAGFQVFTQEIACTDKLALMCEEINDSDEDIVASKNASAVSGNDWHDHVQQRLAQRRQLRCRQKKASRRMAKAVSLFRGVIKERRRHVDDGKLPHLKPREKGVLRNLCGARASVSSSMTSRAFIPSLSCKTSCLASCAL
jgi:hypothetical protein